MSGIRGEGGGVIIHVLDLWQMAIAIRAVYGVEVKHVRGGGGGGGVYVMSRGGAIKYVLGGGECVNGINHVLWELQIISWV